MPVASEPNPGTSAHSSAGQRPVPEPEVPFERKVKLEVREVVAGSCG